MIAVSSSSQANEILREYWSVDQYLTEFEAQQKLTVNFSSLVREQGTPVKSGSSAKVNILVVYPAFRPQSEKSKAANKQEDMD